MKYNWKELLYKAAYTQNKKIFSVDEIIEIIESTQSNKILHDTQCKLLDLIKDEVDKKGFITLNYARLGKAVGINTNQTSKYHILKLESLGYIIIDKEKKQIRLRK